MVVVDISMHLTFTGRMNPDVPEEVYRKVTSTLAKRLLGSVRPPDLVIPAHTEDALELIYQNLPKDLGKASEAGLVVCRGVLEELATVDLSVLAPRENRLGYRVVWRVPLTGEERQSKLGELHRGLQGVFGPLLRIRFLLRL